MTTKAKSGGGGGHHSQINEIKFEKGTVGYLVL